MFRQSFDIAMFFRKSKSERRLARIEILCKVCKSIASFCILLKKQCEKSVTFYSLSSVSFRVLWRAFFKLDNRAAHDGGDDRRVVFSQDALDLWNGADDQFADFFAA